MSPATWACLEIKRVQSINIYKEMNTDPYTAGDNAVTIMKLKMWNQWA